MVFWPELPLESRIAWRNEPGPESLVLFTVNIERRARSSSTSTSKRRLCHRRVRPPERLAVSRKKNPTGQAQRIMIDSSMINKDLYCKTYGCLHFRVARKQVKENAQVSSCGAHKSARSDLALVCSLFGNVKPDGSKPQCSVLKA